MNVFKVEFWCRNCNNKFWKKFEKNKLVNSNGVHSFQLKEGEHINLGTFEKVVIRCPVCGSINIDIINRKPLR